MTILRPKVDPSDVFLSGETTKYVRADGTMAVAADSVARATGATNTANIATNTTNIATNTSNISTNTTDIADHETRIAALEAASGNLLDSDFSATTVTGTTSETTLGSVTLPANSLPAPGEVVFRAWGYRSTNSVNFNHAGQLLKVYWDGNLVGTGMSWPVGATGVNWPWEVIVRLVNSTSTSNQEVTSMFDMMGAGYITDNVPNAVGSSTRVHGYLDYQTATVDTTASKNIELKSTSGTSTDSITRVGFMLYLAAS